MTKSNPPRDRVVVVANCVEIKIQEGIVYVTYLDGAEISVEVKRQMSVAYQEITGGVKHPFLLRSAGKMWVTREAREYARAIEHTQPFLANAMVAESLGFRLLSEFYGRIYKPAVPYRVFKTEEEALLWLRSFL